MVEEGKPYWRGRLNTVDLLLLTSLDQLLLILIILFAFFIKTTYLNKEVNRTEPSPSVSVPCWKCLKVKDIHNLQQFGINLFVSLYGLFTQILTTFSIHVLSRIYSNNNGAGDRDSRENVTTVTVIDFNYDDFDSSMEDWFRKTLFWEAEAAVARFLFSLLFVLFWLFWC
jgi:hypothetical protein